MRSVHHVGEIVPGPVPVRASSLAFIDPVPQVTVYATWREQDPNPAVPVFLDTMRQARERSAHEAAV